MTTTTTQDSIEAIERHLIRRDRHSYYIDMTCAPRASVGDVILAAPDYSDHAADSTRYRARITCITDLGEQAVSRHVYEPSDDAHDDFRLVRSRARVWRLHLDILSAHRLPVHWVAGAPMWMGARECRCSDWGIEYADGLTSAPVVEMPDQHSHLYEDGRNGIYTWGLTQIARVRAGGPVLSETEQERYLGPADVIERRIRDDLEARWLRLSRDVRVRMVHALRRSNGAYKEAARLAGLPDDDYPLWARARQHVHTADADIA